jgi:two-component system alkaline phosphatase synthesis response regulator PhoP
LITILLIEDEDSLMDILSMNLKLEGYEIEQAQSGNEALNLISNDYNLIVLDIMLPDVNGFDICEIIRKESDVPILFISAKGTSADRIKGLTIGADDYLVKPFHLEEFLLRVKILISRHSSKTIQTSTIFNFGTNYTINFKTYEVNSIFGTSTFSKREIDLLKLLTSKKHEVVSREEILNTIWSENASPNSRTIDNYILNFRKHFEKTPKDPKHFISLRGVGYKFIE